MGREQPIYKGLKHMADNREDTALRRMQLEELAILREFVAICKRHGLRYYIIGGTLLGAIRHGGFIPWDDDIDVAMPRPDYERFIRIDEGEFAGPFALSTFEGDASNHYPWARMTSNRMKLVNHMADIPRTELAWIDLIPLDGMPDGGIARAAHKARLSFWWNLNQIVQFDRLVDQKRKRGLLGRLSIKAASCFKWLSRFIDYKTCLRKLNAILKSCPYDSCSKDIVNYLAAFGFDEIFPRAAFGQGSVYRFEDMELIGPDDADAICTKIYGSGYMTPPPIDERNKHHAEIVDG